VFLTIRNKYDVVCIDRRSGNYPLKAQTVSIGESLPLGVSSAGLAILATMKDEDVRHVVQYNAIRISDFHRVRPQEIPGHVKETRKRGYSFYRGHIVAGMGALGFAIKDSRGEALAALSVSAVLDRLTEARVQSLVEMFVRAVEDIESRSALISRGHFGQE
jgi:DNA-binding IclR family transcriptional regulator